MPTGKTPSVTPGISTLASAVMDSTIAEADDRAASSEMRVGDESPSEEEREKTPLRKDESDEERVVVMSSPAGFRAERTMAGKTIGRSSALQWFSC